MKKEKKKPSVLGIIGTSLIAIGIIGIFSTIAIMLALVLDFGTDSGTQGPFDLSFLFIAFPIIFAFLIVGSILRQIAMRKRSRTIFGGTRPQTENLQGGYKQDPYANNSINDQLFSGRNKKFCTKCGHANNTDARFCEKCGGLMDEGSDPYAR